MKGFCKRLIQSRFSVFLVIAASLLMHLGIFGKDLGGFHVWRQAQTQSTILSFAREDINILNPRKNERGNGSGIFRMEFPLSQWITSWPVRISANDVLASRIVNFFFGLLSLFGTYYLIRRLFNSPGLALAGVWILAFTPVFYYYTVNPMPDNLALALSIWGLYWFVRWNEHSSVRNLLIMTIFLSFAGLCKLPFILYFSLPLIRILWHFISEGMDLKILSAQLAVIFAGLALFLSWYIWVIPQWEGNGIVGGIFYADEDQKSKIWYYLWFNLRTTMPELIIGLGAIPLFIAGLFSPSKLWRKSRALFLAFTTLTVMIVGLMVFEINMIETVHDYYFIPLVPVFVLISVYGCSVLLALTRKKPWIYIPFILVFLFMPFYSYLRVHPRWERQGFNGDLMKYKEELRAAVPDSALVCAGNDIWQKTAASLVPDRATATTPAIPWMASRFVLPMPRPR